MKYIIINEEVNIIFGEDCALINNLLTNKVYEVEEYESKILRDMMIFHNINTLEKSFDHDILNKFIENLVSTNCASIKYDYYIKTSLHNGQISPTSYKQSISLQKIVLDLPLECSKSCSFCNSPLLFGCSTCSQNQIDLTLEDYKYNILELIKNISVNIVVVTGGDIFQKFDIIKDFLINIRSATNHLVVYNSLDNLNLEIVKFFNENNIEYNCHLNFEESNVHYELQNLKNKFKILEAFDNSVYLSLIGNERELEQHVLGVQNIVGSDYNIDLKFIIDNKSDLQRSTQYNNVVYVQDFNSTIHYKNVNKCLAGMVSIDRNLNILPCLKMKADILGNVRDNNKFLSFNEGVNLSMYWLDTLSKKCDCDKCAYATYCFDCKAVERFVLESEEKYCPRRMSLL